MCDFDLFTISMLSSELLQTSCKRFTTPAKRCELERCANYLRPLEDLHRAAKTRKLLDEDELEKIYWKYSPDDFFQVNDYISFAAAMILSAEKRFYLLLRDYEEPWEDNGWFLSVMDRIEERRERERHRDIYDVKIKRPGDVDTDEEDEEELKEAFEYVPPTKRTDFEVINYAVGKYPAPTVCYTMDCQQNWKMIQDLKIGIPRNKKVLVVPREEFLPAVKGAKSKKSDKSDKSKKSSKSSSKKGGKKK